jgi:dTMP kinase
VANRYTSSNMAHQTAKLPSKKRKDFLRWLYEMEYKVHKLPKEDVVLFLHLPIEIGQKLVDKKGERGYVGGRRRDIHEASREHLRKACEMYLYLENPKALGQN